MTEFMLTLSWWHQAEQWRNEKGLRPKHHSSWIASASPLAFVSLLTEHFGLHFHLLPYQLRNEPNECFGGKAGDLFPQKSPRRISYEGYWTASIMRRIVIVDMSLVRLRHTSQWVRWYSSPRKATPNHAHHIPSHSGLAYFKRHPDLLQRIILGMLDILNAGIWANHLTLMFVVACASRRFGSCL